MTYFEDLSPYTYTFDSAALDPVRCVGWLDAGHVFRTERPQPHLLDALWAYCSVLVEPTRGLHSCEFCSRPPNTHVRHGKRLLLGSGEIRVFSSTGEAFAAPNLVYHYILEHQYQPPEEFLQAVEKGPRPESDEYRELLGRLAVRWRENYPVPAEPEWFYFVRTANGVERKVKK
jgi:hypothetical protein